MDEKLTIELTPYQALTLSMFVGEFKQDFEGENLSKQFETLKEAIKAFDDQLYDKLTLEQYEYIKHQLSVDKIDRQGPEQFKRVTNNYKYEN